MTSEAKLGLLAGVAAVLLIAVVYHRKPQPAGSPPGSLPAPKSAAVLVPPSVSVSPRPNAVPGPDFTAHPNPADPLLRGPAD